MSKHNKKERRNAKRQAKLREVRKRESASPIKRLAEAPGEVECWMSGFETGQAQIFVYKRAAALSAMACFLVDRGVAGLKDTFVHVGYERQALDETLKTCQRQGIRMARASVEQVRRMVAGGMRWAYENGLRLPKDWAKTAMLIGGVGDWMSADVSGFVKEFSGHPEDLRQRLVSEPFEQYIEREDIDFMFSDAAPYMDQRTGSYSQGDEEIDPESIAEQIPTEAVVELLNRLAPTIPLLTKGTAAWLIVRDVAPSPELMNAWKSILLATAMSNAAMPDAPPAERADFSHELLETLSEKIEEMQTDEYERALDQVLEHLASNPRMMDEAMAKAGEPPDEDGA
jgi:hypothetical protein